MFHVNVLCIFLNDLSIFLQIDGPACDSIKELEGCGFNHYSYVGSDDSDDAADDCVNAAIPDEHVVGEVSMYTCSCWNQLESMYAIRFRFMIHLLFVGCSQ
jgi:hypothetical protein